MKNNKFDESKAFGDSFVLYRDTYMNNGWNEPTQEKVSFDDLLATSNAGEWMPKVVETILREPIEPMIMIPSLLDRIQYSGARITLPAIGSMIAFDVAEAQAYPEQTLNIAPGTITANVGKSGLQFKITEEMRRYSQFDVINMHIRQARSALARHKEVKGFEYIKGLGVTLFDNLSPTTSVYGTCTGRSIDGSGNGSCRMEDLVKAFSQIMLQGFMPNTLLMHPLTWSMWLTDPLLQTIVKNTGSGAWFRPHSAPLSSNDWQSANQNKLGLSGGRTQTPGGNAASETATGVLGHDQNLSTAPSIPDYFPYPLTVLVSPFVPFNVENQTADMFLFDSQNLGALIVDEEVTVDTWEDMSHDIINIKLRERYGFGVYNDGLGVGVLRNIPVKANEIAFPAVPTISASTSFSELDVTSAISL